MKKLLSVLLSLVLCASVVVTNPPIEIGEGTLTQPQNEQTKDYGDTTNPCDSSEGPGHSGDVQS